MSDRIEASLHFLIQAGWSLAGRSFLAGDASDRSYDRLRLGDRTAVLMDAPPGQGDDPAAFVAIARHLHGLGLSAPRILAQDLAQGFLLLEDLGDDTFARVLSRQPELAAPLYETATDVLLRLQSAPIAPGLPDLAASDWAIAASFALDWYRFAAIGDRMDKTGFVARLADLIAAHADGPRVMILRDYHAENLMWLPQRQGIARAGVLDFQLAQAGQPAYDLVSLLQDARRDVSPAIEAAMQRRFLAASGGTEESFSASYAVIGAQRSLRILGIFARLCLHGGKPGYVALIPRVWGHLLANLSHPVLADFAILCNDLLPPPSPQILKRIGDQCAHFR